jgi:hypothetical protein
MIPMLAQGPENRSIPTLRARFIFVADDGADSRAFANTRRSLLLRKGRRLLVLCALYAFDRIAQ